jgi:hypothetical protein
MWNPHQLDNQHIFIEPPHFPKTRGDADVEVAVPGLRIGDCGGDPENMEWKQDHTTCLHMPGKLPLRATLWAGRQAAVKEIGAGLEHTKSLMARGVSSGLGRCDCVGIYNAQGLHIPQTLNLCINHARHCPFTQQEAKAQLGTSGSHL